MNESIFVNSISFITESLSFTICAYTLHSGLSKFRLFTRILSESLIGFRYFLSILTVGGKGKSSTIPGPKHILNWNIDSLLL